MQRSEENLTTLPRKPQPLMADSTNQVLEKPSASSSAAASDSLRTFRLVGATAALLAVLGLTVLVFWFVIQAPQF